MALQQPKEIAGGGDFELGFEPLADAFGLAGFFKHAEGFVADSEDLLPLFQNRSGIFRRKFLRAWGKARDAR